MVRLVVRRLPLSATEEEARAKVSELGLEKTKVQYFVAAKRTKRRGVVPGRLYLATQAEDVLGKLLSAFPVAEKAPFDKVFRDPSRKDKRQNTWKKSPAFLEDFKAFQANGGAVPTTSENDQPKTSALVDFINQRGSLFGASQAESSRKKKKKKQQQQQQQQQQQLQQQRRKNKNNRDDGVVATSSTTTTNANANANAKPPEDTAAAATTQKEKPRGTNRRKARKESAAEKNSSNNPNDATKQQPQQQVSKKKQRTKRQPAAGAPAGSHNPVILKRSSA